MIVVIQTVDSLGSNRASNKFLIDREVESREVILNFKHG